MMATVRVYIWAVRRQKRHTHFMPPFCKPCSIPSPSKTSRLRAMVIVRKSCKRSCAQGFLFIQILTSRLSAMAIIRKSCDQVRKKNRPIRRPSPCQAAHRKISTARQARRCLPNIFQLRKIGHHQAIRSKKLVCHRALISRAL